jgi:adenylate cyclase
MRIRSKLLLVVLPLVVTPLLLLSLASVLAARNGITQVAAGALLFKAEELRNYAETQWKLLESNKLSGDPAFVAVSKTAVESFARSLVRSRTELILALDADKRLAFRTADVEPTPGELDRLAELAAARRTGWQQVRFGGAERVGQALLFEPFGWYLLVSEKSGTFYQAVNQIALQSGVLLLVALAAVVSLLFVFIRYMTRPIGQMLGAMRGIITTNDLSRRVDAVFKDEIGELSHTFNIMTGELQQAWDQIKKHAFDAVIARRKEEKIRNIFQKFVPAEVIDKFFSNPESLLAGENRVLAVLFSDIRGFTTISERMLPDQMVDALNAYFELMVDTIVRHSGVVDKFIGDAIMAFFGAPVKHTDDAQKAVHAGLEMLTALEKFNAQQVVSKRPAFKIGIGINYGVVTVGNIGHHEKKMEYTVIGDMVNLASRLEGLTKTYQVPFLISESVFRKVEKEVPCRLVDRVVVRGKKDATNIYQPKKSLDPKELQGWELYKQGLPLYYGRQFEKAGRLFNSALERMPEDAVTKRFLALSELYASEPPEADWTGTNIIAAQE